MSNFPASNYNLLLVEDNPGDIVLIQDYLHSIISQLKMDVCKTYSRAESLLSANQDTYDCILLDLKLPDKEGEELIREVISLAKPVPVIVLTGYSDMQFSIRSLNLGVSDYIVKDELNEHVLWKSIRYSIERNLASQKLLESESRYRYLFENNPSSILIWDFENRQVLDSNHEAERKYGYSKKQFREMKIDQVLPDGSAGNVLDGDNLKHQNNVFTHKKKDGGVFMAEVRSHIIEYQGRKAVLLLINDVTEKVKMQERLLENSIRAEEEERSRIAKELHDGIVQQLVACGFYTQNIANKLEHDEKLSEEVEQLYELLIKSTIQTRDISHNLKSAEFDMKTLPELFNQLARQLSQAGSIQFTINNHLSLDTDYKIHLKTNIYRSVQELCNNIVKHSKASEAIITVEEIEQVLYITIKDDGDGFDYNDPDNAGFGLQSVESRILRLGGKIEFGKPDNGGLQVDLEIPVTLNREYSKG